MAPHIHAYRAGLAAMVGLGAKSTYNSHRNIAQTGTAYRGTEETNGVPGTLGRRLTRRITNGSMPSTELFNSIQEELKRILGKKQDLVTGLLVRACLVCSCCKNMCKINHVNYNGKAMEPASPATPAQNTLTHQKVMLLLFDLVSSPLLLSKLVQCEHLL
jgi:hypothetical protein